MKTFLAFLVIFTFTFALPAQAKRQPTNKTEKAKITKASKSTKTSATYGAATLFNRLGGNAAITAVVDQFVANCAGDARVASFFSGTAADASRMTKFKKHLVDQICQAAGGPCKYTGKDMKSAHFGMGVKNEHFDAVVEDLTAALNQNKVGATEQAELLKVLGGMRGDIVEQKS